VPLGQFFTHYLTVSSGLPKYPWDWGQVETHLFVLLSPNFPYGHFFTHFQVDSSAKYPSWHPVSHLFVNSSANLPIEHFSTQTLSVYRANNYGTSGHFIAQDLVELSA